MTDRRKWGLFLLLVLFAVIAASAVLAARLYLPAHPARPYFPVAQTRLPQLHWLFGRFQPVFLYPFTRGDSGFLRVAYRDFPNQNSPAGCLCLPGRLFGWCG